MRKIKYNNGIRGTMEYVMISGSKITRILDKDNQLISDRYTYKDLIVAKSKINNIYKYEFQFQNNENNEIIYSNEDDKLRNKT